MRLADAYYEATKGDPEAQRRLYHATYAAATQRAREDPAFFVEWVIPHEKTSRPIKNARFHEEWHEFLSSVRWGVIIAPIEHGKSLQISVGRILWELGRNPNLRILLLGRGDAAAQKSLGLIMQHIEQNRVLHEVFPNLKRSTRKRDPWSKSDIVVERTSFSRDPSVQARGMGSGNILGSRLDLIVFDDGLDLDNTRTLYQRDKTEEWFDTVVFSRLVEDYERQDFGRVFAIGTPFNSDDLLHRLGRRPGWRMAHYSAVENPEDHPSMWRPIWAAAWPLQRILDKRDGMTLTAFARTLLCQILDSATRRFKRVWLEHATRLGRGRQFFTQPPTEHGVPMPCVVGIDPGVGKKTTDAVTSIAALAVDSHGRRILAHLESGHWTGPEILERAQSVGKMFDAEVLAEGNAAQVWLEHFGQELPGLNIRAVNTGSEKWSDELGVEALAVLCRNGYFVVPSEDGTIEHTAPEAKALLEEMHNFDPSAHTGDRLMSVWIADRGVRERLRERQADSGHMER